MIQTTLWGSIDRLSVVTRPLEPGVRSIHKHSEGVLGWPQLPKTRLKQRQEVIQSGVQ
jgi:hypothetical protein